MTVLTRRPIGVTHAKLSDVIVRDCLDYSAIRLDDADSCIWGLGVSQSQVGKEQYVVITHDYAVAGAAAMIAANPRLRFCFVSGRSADPTEQASQLYARIKGRTERTLSELYGIPVEVDSFAGHRIVLARRGSAVVKPGVDRRA